MIFNDFLEKVRAFHVLTSCAAPAENTLLATPQRAHRVGLLAEEVKELLEADTAVEQLDAVLDLLYVTLGTAVEMGVTSEQLDEGFNRVHQNNMTKVGPDGKPILREDGKVLKPEGYVKVSLEGILTI